MEHSKPTLGPIRTKYLKSMYKRPVLHCGSYFGIILLLTGIVNSAYPLLSGESDMSDPSAPAKIAFDIVNTLQNSFDVDEDEKNKSSIEVFTFAYKWKDDRDASIFTAENLQSMCKVEQVILQKTFNISEPCTRESPETCATTYVTDGSPFTASIVNIFYELYFQSTFSTFFNHQDCPLLPDAVVLARKNFIQSQVLDVTSPLRGFVNDETKSTLTRSFVGIADQDEDKLEDLVLEIEEDLVKLFDLKASFARSRYRDPAIIGDIEVFFVNGIVLQNEFDALVPSDITMILGSFTFVSLWMLVYTRSLFLTVCNMTYILLSVTVALFFYKMIAQITYFDFIHVLAIFLVLGIGADGAFVVIDAFKQGLTIYEDEEDVLFYAYKRSVATVFNTSFTTVFAFAVTGITPLVPISTFGIYAALTIAVNFLYTCTISPVTMLIWCRYIRRKKSATVVQEEKSKEDGLESLVSGNNKCFHKLYVPAMLKSNKFLFCLGILIGVFGIYGITNVQQLTKPEQWLPDDHMLTKYIEVLSDEFLGGTSGEYTEITVFWGVDTIERDIFSRYTGDQEKYKDTLIYDENFDPSKPEAQEAMIGLCKTLKEATCSKDDCLGSTTLLLPESEFYNHTCTMELFAEYWEENNITGAPLANNTDSNLFFDELKTFRDLTPGAGQLIGFVDGKLRYFAHTFRITMQFVVPGPDKVYYEDTLNQIMSDYEKSAPASAKLVDYASGEFVQLAVERALISTVVRGLLIIFPVVFLILLFATKNYVLATLSVTAILFIVITVLGIVFTIIGWELGTAESIVAIMIVGLSVDYTVHLGHMYVVAGWEGYQTREDRFHYAVLTMGPTILAGGMTTLGAGLFLFGCQITFFTKMGVLLTLTVIFSMFYSLIFLMAGVSWFGPEGNYANATCLMSKEERKGSLIVTKEAVSL